MDDILWMTSFECVSRQLRTNALLTFKVMSGRTELTELVDDYECFLLYVNREFISCILLHCEMRHSAGHSVGNCYRKQTSTHCTIMLAPHLSPQKMIAYCMKHIDSHELVQ